MVKTTFEDFAEAAERLTPVTAEIVGDLDTPISAFIKTTRPGYRFLLESADRGGRYSIIGDTPLLIFKSKDKRVTLQNCWTNTVVTLEDNPFDVLQGLLRKYARHRRAPVPFINNGFFGYWSYDAVRRIEVLPQVAVDDLNLPDIHLFVPQRIIVFDNLLHKITLVYFALPGTSLSESYNVAVEQLEAMADQIRRPLEETPAVKRTASKKPESTMSRYEFEERVGRCKQHIACGDVFQIVLSQRLKIETEVPALQIYRGLRTINPSPYMFFMDLEGLELLGSSPETLVKLSGGEVTLKPIAGTRRRGADDAEDRRLIADLVNDPKERAEHVMLVDLGRNDLGRIAEYGSVHVAEFMAVEKYSHVIHLVSTLKAKLAGGDAVDVFKACFPAGTLTGAPKVKAMELIDRYEPVRRSIYGGAVGYMTFNGDMDVCIAIRTIFKKDGIAYLQAGAGVVADSVPEHEYLETMNKANGLLQAVALAEGGL